MQMSIKNIDYYILISYYYKGIWNHIHISNKVVSFLPEFPKFFVFTAIT